MTNEKAIKIIKRNCYVFNPLDFDESTMINRSLDLAVKALETNTGHWNTYKLSQGGIDEEWLECSECMWSNALLIPRNYCPNCGARMEVENGE